MGRSSRPHPPTGKATVTFVNFKISVPPHLRGGLKIRAADLGLSTQALVRRYLQEGLDRDAND